VSAAFLLLVALINLLILRSVYQAFGRVRRGERIGEQEMNAILTGGGPIARLLRPLFRLISRPWHLYPLGLLFGLGFDTATEIGLLGIAAVQASQSLPIWSILVFPALFTAGMALVDTADSVMMTGAYHWALVNPARKLYYNLTITSMSVLVALLVGGWKCSGWSRRVGTARRRVGLHHCTDRQLRHDRLPDRRDIHPDLGRFRGVLPLQGLRPPGRDACLNLFFLSSPGKGLSPVICQAGQCFRPA
jgi:HoxN/HupN/NixA family high-affinity nickel-transporter